MTRSSNVASGRRHDGCDVPSSIGRPLLADDDEGRRRPLVVSLAAVGAGAGPTKLMVGVVVEWWGWGTGVGRVAGPFSVLMSCMLAGLCVCVACGGCSGWVDGRRGARN